MALKLDTEESDEHFLSLIYYMNYVAKPRRPFGPGWFLRELRDCGPHREALWRQFRKLERKGYIELDGFSRPERGKGMAAFRITNLGMIHAMLSTLEQEVGDEDKVGRDFVMLIISQAIKQLRTRRNNLRDEPSPKVKPA